MAVVSPGTLSDAVAVVKACVAADVAILPQGANTSLTGGACPRSTQCDRPTVVVNMRRLNKILPVGEGGEQVLCFSGAGILNLKNVLENEYGRDSHSVLGSIFLNPSVAAGVSYGSGGTQIRKGPAYTDRALFLKVNGKGEVEIVDTLGLKQGTDPISYLENLQQLSKDDLDPACTAAASWPKYPDIVTNLNSEVSRFNADTRGEDCNRSEGKVLMLASLHDTFPLPKFQKLYWVSCKDFETCWKIKKEVCISSTDVMAKTCEYMNRDTFDAVDQAGRVMIMVLDVLGMDNLKPLWDLKILIETSPLPFSKVICDKVLYLFNNVLPASLTPALMELGKSYDHHMLIELAEYTDGEVEQLEKKLQACVDSSPPGAMKVHCCEDKKEAARATYFRFVVASSFRTWHIGRGEQGLSIDYTLPKNHESAPLYPDNYPMEKRVLYGHFGCNVYHEDIMFGPGVDQHEAKMVFKKTIEQLGGRLPAEHGHGTEYAAPPETHARWKKMDPTNAMNPGVGHLSYNKDYHDVPLHLRR